MRASDRRPRCWHPAGRLKSPFGRRVGEKDARSSQSRGDHEPPCTVLEAPAPGAPRGVGSPVCILALAALIASCGSNEPTAARAPGGGKGTYSPSGGAKPTSQPDVSMDGASDAAVGGGSEVPEGDCYPVEGSSRIAMPTDFTPTHVAATWLHGCDMPTVLIALSEGGCPDGRGHELVFNIEPAAIDDGLLLLGNNPLATTLGGFAVRYRRAAPVMPTGEWGNCSSAGGSFDLDRFAPATPGQISMRFNMSLTDCTGSATAAYQVSGNIDVPLARGLATLCP